MLDLVWFMFCLVLLWFVSDLFGFCITTSVDDLQWKFQSRWEDWGFVAFDDSQHRRFICDGSWNKSLEMVKRNFNHKSNSCCPHEVSIIPPSSFDNSLSSLSSWKVEHALTKEPLNETSSLISKKAKGLDSHQMQDLPLVLTEKGRKRRRLFK